VRVEAVEGGGSAVWQQFTANLLTLGVWTEKSAGRGEDAHPLVLHNWRAHRGLAAVFDGLGGAGAGRAGHTAGGVGRSSAWAAAHGARGLVEEWFLDACEQAPACDPAGLRDHLAGRLVELRGTGRRKILGTMRRELPTTFAGLAYQVDRCDVRWQALWAGDSRCYLLDPLAGLQQLTRDDTESDDALTLLVEDPPMTNVINAGGTFVVNENRGAVGMPCLFVTATDGFFGYLDTPAEFEHVLLDTLVSAADAADWGDRLAARVASYTGDDASLSAVAFGFADFARLRAAFTRRAREVLVDHVEPVRDAADDRDAFVARRADSWRRYREHYERRMPREDRQ
jgi:serine/threonine protein phosphatase PrpC